MHPLSYVYRPSSGAVSPTSTGTAVSILLAAFTVSVFVSTALTNILAGLVCIAAIIRWATDRPWHLLRHPLILACLAVVGWALVREVAAGASPREMLATADHLRVLLFVPLWAPLFVSQRHADAVIGTACAMVAVYAAGALGLLAFTGQVPYSSVTGGLAETVGGPQALQVTIDTLVKRSPDIAGPAFLAIIFGALQHALDREAWRRWLLAFVLLATAALFLATVRRQTQLGFVLCLLAFAWFNRHQISRRAWAVLALGAALAVPVVGMMPSGSGLKRVADAARTILDAPAPSRTHALDVATSEGQRVRLWAAALPAIKDYPVIGTAVSRYADHYFASGEETLQGMPETANPHNEFLYFWGALGLVGLLLYLATPLAAWHAVAGDPFRRRILVFYTLAMFNAMMVNSLVIDMIAAHAHVLVFLALVMPMAQHGTGNRT
jgi:O-antigen ligase